MALGIVLLLFALTGWGGVLILRHRVRIDEYGRSLLELPEWLYALQYVAILIVGVSWIVLSVVAIVVLIAQALGSG